MNSTVRHSLAVLGVAMTAMITAGNVSALSPSYYTKTSALASGHWAKVKASGAGIHQITYQQLRDLGFTDPAKVRVCGYGPTLFADNVFDSSRPDDITTTASMHTADGRLLFYSTGDVTVSPSVNTVYGVTEPQISRNYYSSDAYYLLTDSDMGAPLPAVAFKDITGYTRHTHRSISYYEPEVQNVGRGSVLFHGPQVAAGGSCDLPFTIRDFAGPAAVNADRALTGTDDAVTRTIGEMWLKGAIANFDYSFMTAVPQLGPAAGTAIDVAGDMKISMLFNKAYAFQTGEGYYKVYADNDSIIADGTHVWTLKFPATSDCTYAAFDRGSLIYPRMNRLTADAGGLDMHYTDIEGGDGVVISNATPSTVVWDVSDAARVFPHEGRYDAEKGTLTVYLDGSTSSRHLVAFDSSADQLPVTAAGQIANQNIHGSETPDMLIVTTDALYDKACELAEIHRSIDGLDVAVWRQSEVFNEFGAGNATIMAVRRLAKMYYDRNSSKFSSLLLYGTATWDPRGIVLPAENEHLFTYEIEDGDTEINNIARHANINFATDNYFGMLGDTFRTTNILKTNVDIAVGRLPLDSEGEAADVNAKIREYITKGGSIDAQARVLLISDDGDKNAHLTQSEELATGMTALNPALTFIRAHNSIYPRPNNNAAEARKLIGSSLVEGVGLFSYTGHGRPTYFAQESIWSQNYVDKTGYSSLPMAILSTCDTYELDRNERGIAEQMVKKAGGGAIAAVAAVRSVYLEHNQRINTAVANEYASASGNVTVGEIFRKAINTAIKNANSTNSSANTLCYNLCGDPAIRIAAPSLKVNVTAINGKAPADSARTEAAPNDFVTLSGTVTDREGNTASGFNGIANIYIYETPDTVPVIKKDANDLDADIIRDEQVLVTAVTDGQWQVRLFIPHPVRPGESNRMVITANGTIGEGRTFALGNSDRLRVLGTSTNTFTGAGPEITEFYLNDNTFADGDIVSSDFTVRATIVLGDAGLSKSSALGAGAKLILDGKSNINGAGNAITLNADNTASMSLPVAEIEDGRHSLVLTVADNAGNHASASLAFTVINGGVTSSLSADREISRDEVVFDLAHGFTDDSDVNTLRLVIRDAAGNTVFSASDVSFPYTWDLRDNNGADVADGHYRASVTKRVGHSYTATPAIPVVVIRR